MIGKEIGGIIGKGGANVNSFREKSGAKITISTAQSCPERIVTITGSQSQIHTAIELMTGKIHEDLNNGLLSEATNKIPVTIRIIVPASQCGSIIGKGGQKIKEIRDTTGCAIQVQSDMLPNSSERTVTLSGSPSTIVHCVNLLCDVMIQYPAKQATIPYQPQTSNGGLINKNSYMIPGQFPMGDQMGMRFARGGRGDKKLRGFGDGCNDLEALMQSGNVNFNFPSRMISTSVQEVYVPNDVVGCIIGKGGNRIKEIRMISTAQIKIERLEESAADHLPFDNNTSNGSQGDNQAVAYRKIIIYGAPDAICYAQYLINLSVQVYGPPDKNHHHEVVQQCTNIKQQPDSTPKPLMHINVPPPNSNARNKKRNGQNNSSLLGHPPQSMQGIEHERNQDYRSGYREQTGGNPNNNQFNNQQRFY